MTGFPSGGMASSPLGPVRVPNPDLTPPPPEPFRRTWLVRYGAWQQTFRTIAGALEALAVRDTDRIWSGRLPEPPTGVRIRHCATRALDDPTRPLVTITSIPHPRDIRSAE